MKTILKACEYFQKSRTLGYEKKYYNKELASSIKKSCEPNSKNISSKSEILSPKDMPYIAPNPAQDNVEVFNYPYLDFNFTISDVEGKQILNGKANNKTIQISGLSTGLYLLIIEQGGKQVTLKLIKE